MEYAQQVIVDFLKGDLDIVEFRRLYDEKPEIDAFLQKIIDGFRFRDETTGEEVVVEQFY